MKPEKILALQIARYLQLRYPDVIYRYDLAADVRLTIGQASRNKALHPRRGYPDLFIAEPRGSYSHGLFLELKVVPVHTKNGKLKISPHLKEQQDMLTALRARGYAAQFVVGFEQAKVAIDTYLSRARGK